MTPRPEFRPLLGPRAWIKKIATGWTIQPDGSADYEAVDDWAIEFTETPEASASGVGGGNGAEDEIRTRDPLLGKEVLYH